MDLLLKPANLNSILSSHWHHKQPNQFHDVMVTEWLGLEIRRTYFNYIFNYVLTAYLMLCVCVCEVWSWY